MPYSIEFQISGFLVVLVITVVFFSKPRWQSLQNSIFRILMPFTLLELAFDIISVITIAERDNLPPLLNDFFSKGYIVIMIFWIMLVLIYVLSNFYGETGRIKKKTWLILIGIFIVLPAVVFSGISIATPLLYANYGRHIYSYGIPSTCTYLYSIYGVTITTVTLIFSIGRLRFKRIVPMLAFTIMEGSVALVQMVNKELLIIGFGTALCILFMYMTLENPDMDLIARLNDANRRANNLLLNILPASVAQELKEDTRAFTEKFDSVTVAFIDIVNFTKLSEQIGAEATVRSLNKLFSEIDSLLDGFRVEKIKTIGDAYMIAAGLPERYDGNCREMISFLMAVKERLEDFNKRNKTDLHVRIGVHSGPVVAGIIGTKKFIYDLWGSTVNFASRLESNGIPDRIQVSAAVKECMKDTLSFEERPPMDIKGFGLSHAYLIV